MTDDTNDDLMRSLSLLPPLMPNAAHADRVRTRCLVRLARGRRSHQGFGRILAPVIVLGFCAVYLAALVRTALHLRNML
jgi:hypothetical protein